MRTDQLVRLPSRESGNAQRPMKGRGHAMPETPGMSVMPHLWPPSSHESLPVRVCGHAPGTPARTAGRTTRWRTVADHGPERKHERHVPTGRASHYAGPEMAG
jgi:hypothetical protein